MVCRSSPRPPNVGFSSTFSKTCSTASASPCLETVLRIFEQADSTSGIELSSCGETSSLIVASTSALIWRIFCRRL